MEHLGIKNKNNYLQASYYSLASFSEVDTSIGFYGWLASKLYDDIFYSIKTRLVKSLGIKENVKYNSVIREPLGSKYYDDFSRLVSYCISEGISVGAYIENTFVQQQLIFKDLDTLSYGTVYNRYIRLFPTILFKDENHAKYKNTIYYYNNYRASLNQSVPINRHSLKISNSVKAVPSSYLADYILNKAVSGNTSFESDIEGLFSVLNDKYEDFRYGQGDYSRLISERLNMKSDELVDKLTSLGVSNTGISEILAVKLYGCNFGAFNYYPIYAMNDFVEDTITSLYDSIVNKNWSSMTNSQTEMCYWFSFGIDSKLAITDKKIRLKSAYSSIYYLKCSLLVCISILKSFRVLKINFRNRVDIGLFR